MLDCIYFDFYRQVFTQHFMLRVTMNRLSMEMDAIRVQQSYVYK